MTEAMENSLIMRGIQVYVQCVCFLAIGFKLVFHRCFPDVINLAAQDFLDAIKTLNNPYGIALCWHHYRYSQTVS
jgi:hypothetical protein